MAVWNPYGGARGRAQVASAPRERPDGAIEFDTADGRTAVFSPGFRALYLDTEATAQLHADPEVGSADHERPGQVQEHLAGPRSIPTGTQKGSPMTLASRDGRLMGAGGGPARLQETEAWHDLAHGDQTAARADVQAESGRSDYPATHTGNSPQDRMIEATAADAEAIRHIRDMYRDTGWPERQAEAEGWLAVAEQDHAAAVAGIDYRDLTAMGPESVMTEPAPCCGYPEADREADQ